jgi:glycosyltransferase involved in cell wall biosynthesis
VDERIQTAQRSELFPGCPDVPLIAFIGRLTKVKKLQMLIETLARLRREQHPFNLLIVGDGPERQPLEALAASVDGKDWIRFHGATHDEAQIARLLASSDLVVSPGNVGLTGIHALVYGTPVITHGSFAYQGPEFEAITPGKNGLFFKADDPEDLGRKILEWFAQPSYDRAQIRANCYEVVDQHYNPAFQVQVINQAVKDLLTCRPRRNRERP